MSQSQLRNKGSTMKSQTSTGFSAHHYAQCDPRGQLLDANRRTCRICPIVTALAP